MPSRRSRLRSAACLLLAVCGTAAANPSFTKRQAVDGTDAAGDAPVAQLEPVVPPVVDPNDLAVLTPAKAVQLFFQSSPESRKRDGQVIAAQVDFNFRYPAVPLDHSDYVAGISCTSKTVKTTFDGAAGYQQAAKSWPAKSKFILITSTAGCGSDDTENGYFVASSAAFDSASLSVTAQGTFAKLNQTYADMTVTWGKAPAAGSDSKRLMTRDDCNDDWCGSHTFDFNFSPEIVVDLVKGKSQEEAEAAASEKDDHEAPWENAFLLWSSSNGDDDNTPAQKRSVIPSEERGLEVRKVEKGFNLYCVDCGISGEFTLGGVISYCVLCLHPGITKAQVYVDGKMDAGIYLGLEAFAEYEKEWKKRLILINLLGWQIAGLVSIGPYIQLDLKATFGIKAQGTLLMGGGASWSHFGATLDFVGDGSGQFGWQPELVQKFEAKGELSIESTLGLPLSVGVGIDVHDGFWTAHAALVDTPQLKAEASISIAYINNNKYSTVDGQKIKDDNNGLDLNDDCYGVKYEIGFENVLDFEAELDGAGTYTHNLDTYKYTFLEGCLGYQKPACEDEVRASPVIGEGVQCNQPLDGVDAGNSGYEEGDTQTVATEEFCAGLCMASKKCHSFTWAADSTGCQLYSVDVASLLAAGTAGSSLALFDRDCWQTKDCPYNATDPDAGSTKHKRMQGMYDTRSGMFMRPFAS